MDFITIWYIIEHSVNRLTIKNAVFYLKSWNQRFFWKIFDPGPSNSFSPPPFQKCYLGHCQFGFKGFTDPFLKVKNFWKLTVHYIFSISKYVHLLLYPRLRI